MTDLKFASPSGETTIKLEGTGRLGTVAPKTQLHITEMNEKVALLLTIDELKLIDKYIELNDETQSVFDKIKDAYPQPTMNLQQEGDYAVVSYNDTTYYRFMNETTFAWYMKIEYSTPTLVMVTDAETERLLDGLYYNHIEVKKEKEQRQKELVRESVKWCEEHPDKDPLDYLKVFTTIILR